MNVVLRKILGWIPAVIFLLGMAFVSIPDLWLRRTLGLIRLSLATFIPWRFQPPTAKQWRMIETAWQFRWARIYLWLIKKIMGIHMPIHVDDRVTRAKPSIILINHRTVTDHLLAAQVLKDLELPHTLWILKDGMRKVIELGRSSSRAGYAFVTRNGDVADKDRVRAMARLARKDGASVALYPEGTRHDGFPREDGAYRHLRDPKRGGLQILLDELPDYQIVFVCIDYRQLRGSRTLWDGDGLLGIHGRVTVWAMDLVPGDDAESVLEEGWARMDELLATRHRDPALATARTQQA